MSQYKVVFRVNNIRSEQIVSANCVSNAKKLIQAQYGMPVNIISVTKI